MKVSIFTVCDYYEDAHPGPDAYFREKIDLARQAEDLGFHGFFVAEHHFHPYGLVPDPAVLLSAMAVETSRIALGPAVSNLPFHNPVRVAEQYCLVDQLSRGRLVFGVGSGYLQHEFEGFGLSPANKRQRFDEALEVIEKAMTGKRFSHQGEFFKVPKTKLNVAPWGGRKIEPKIAILSELAAYYVGKRGYGIMTVPYATVEHISDAALLYANYRKGWRESGKPGDGEVYAAIHTHCGDHPAAESPVNRRHLEKYVLSRLYAKHSDYDTCLRRGVVAAGTPEEVTTMLQTVVDTGVDHLMLLVDYGAMPPGETRASLERLAKDVIPNLRDHAAAAA
ncbi:MAG: LLM class flavin-dependent oxidoreductase [Planctomycetes bacterium]|jgi:alkanesulfonate monooxygenase SsuD/methylene tetrahydromethanopterin reductase-like flavin-dependent oxidoreductase (luciferase family)|nr:LLM class flavin-dependent oxidoreductase [Planctomycetota bacterium]